MSRIQDIISDIEKESCVLVIGPDLLDFGDKSFFEALCDELNANSEYNHLIDITPEFIFVHEELFQLKPSTKETTLLRYIEQFYKKQTRFNEPFRQISRIPFHLIISFMPDTRLKSIFEEQRIEFRYGYYPLAENPLPVEKPTRKVPLIYNLVGDFNERDSIITFEHLFLYLSGIMGKRELPQYLDEAFKKARTFIFVGVRFETWYVQLLLRIITAREKREKHTILRKNGLKNDIYTFIATRLDLDFLETDPLDFIQQLYQECDERLMLKKIGKVFLSYSHLDKETASLVEEHLKSVGIEVVIDQKSMSIGQKIESFNAMISDVSCVLCIISRNSLQSIWVSKEIVTTLKQTGKHFLPCYIDNTFLDKNFADEMGETADSRLKYIAEQVDLRGRANTNDLFNENKDWSDYINNLPMILDELKRRNCISLKPDDFDKNMKQVVSEILKNQ